MHKGKPILGIHFVHEVDINVKFNIFEAYIGLFLGNINLSTKLLFFP